MTPFGEARNLLEMEVGLARGYRSLWEADFEVFQPTPDSSPLSLSPCFLMHPVVNKLTAAISSPVSFACGGQGSHADSCLGIGYL